MKIIEHSLLVDIKDKTSHSLLINTISGEIYVLSADEAQLVRRWKADKTVIYSKENSQNLVQMLKQHNFLVDGQEDENNLVLSALVASRDRHNELKERGSAATFVLTYMCNFACPYCYEDARSYQKERVMTTDMVDRIFAINNGHIRHIGFYGGEPLLPETKNIIEYIVNRSPESIFTVTTNGYYLAEYFDIFKPLRINNIMITLDGSEKLHNKTRKLKMGGGTFKKVFDGICLYLKNSIPIKIRMNISPENMENCLSLRENLIKDFPKQFNNKVLRFELQPIFQLAPNVRSKLEDKLIFSPQTTEGTPYKYNTIAYSTSPILRCFVNNSNVAFHPRYCNCDAEGRQRFYDAEGNIYSCILALRNTAAIVGTYYPVFSLKENSMLTRNIETISECKNCILKFLCGGGCANEIIDKDGGVMKPNCDRIRREIFSDLPRLSRQFIEE